MYLTHRNKHREFGKNEETEEHIENGTKHNLRKRTKGSIDKQYYKERVQGNNYKRCLLNLGEE